MSKISRRYCGHCDIITKFKYNSIVAHSECTICGWRLVPTLKKTDFDAFKVASERAWQLFDEKEKTDSYNCELEKRC